MSRGLFLLISAQLLGSLQVLIFLDKGVAKDSARVRPLRRVFPQNKGHEAAELRRTGRHVEVLCHYLGEFFLCGDFEGIVARLEFVGESADGPGVNFLVVVQSHEDLRREVEGGATDR